MIPSPMLNSKFSPSSTIGRSPVISKKSIFNQKEIKKSVSPFITNFKLNPDEDKVETEKEKEGKINVNRKARNMFKNIEEIDKKPKFFKEGESKYEDLPITSCINTGKKDEYIKLVNIIVMISKKERRLSLKGI